MLSPRAAGHELSIWNFLSLRDTTRPGINRMSECMTNQRCSPELEEAAGAIIGPGDLVYDVARKTCIFNQFVEVAQRFKLRHVLITVRKSDLIRLIKEK